MLKNLIIALLLLGSLPVYSEEAAPLKAELISNHTAIIPGQNFQLLLDIQLDSGWHIYWKNPGDSGMAPSLEWKLPEGLEIVHVDWPTPERFESENTITFGYSNHAPLLVTVHSSETLKKQILEIEADLQWIVCSNDTCLPGITSLKAVVNVGEEAKITESMKKRFTEVNAVLPKNLPPSSLKSQTGSLVVSFPNEIAMGDIPLFFPETGTNYKSAPKVLSNKKEVEIPHTDDSVKGVLVIGNKAYSLDHKTPPSPIETESLGLFWAILFALAGGLILNLMPCVLPVVSLKIMGFVKASGDSRKELMLHGLGFTSGVLVSFWILAAILIGLQATGKAVGWGFQLQDPIFISALALLFTFLALNLFGVFEIGTSFSSLAPNTAQVKKKSSYSTSFWSGIFATIVATPCTGPFMGSALGYALTQPAYISFIIFTALGIGMSLPYLLIGMFPSCIRFLPKPGAWMESFKQFLGFVMLATVVWLLWVFEGQTSAFGLVLLLFALLIAAMGTWIYGRFGALHRKKSARKISYFFTALFLISSFCLAKTASDQVSVIEMNTHTNWEPFSAEKVAVLRKQGQPILIDFTAKWCLICQLNHLVLSHKDVTQKFKERGIVLMKADWTRHDPAITEALNKYGRNGVPLYVLYGVGAEPIILPQILTPDVLISTIDTMPSNVH